MQTIEKSNQRIIKYRSYDETNDKFWYFEFPSIKSTWDWEFFDITRKLNHPIQQFTGLKDSEGNEIFEGDIVLLPNEYYKMYRSTDWNGKEDGIYVVIWDDLIGGFVGSNYEFCHQHYLWIIVNHCKIIGNIYESRRDFKAIK